MKTICFCASAGISTSVCSPTADIIPVIVGEIANFAAYAFAPAILVTPLGALSIIIRKSFTFLEFLVVSFVWWVQQLLYYMLLQREIESVREVWDLATEPGFLFYAFLVILAVFVLIIHFIPQYGQTHIMVYIGICSLVGSLSVMSVKALGIALKLTFSGTNQLMYPQTWTFTLVVAVCVVTQMNYLNKHDLADSNYLVVIDLDMLGVHSLLIQTCM